MPTYIEYVHARPEFDEILFALSKGNEFTAADLDANRRGKVGRDQVIKHLGDALLPPLNLLGVGLLISFLTRVAYAGYVEKKNIFSFIGTFFLQLGALDLLKAKKTYLESGGEHLPWIVMLFVVTAPLTAYKKLRKLPVRLLIDLARQKVSQAEGSVYTETEEVKAPGKAGKQGETIPLHYYVINDQKIKVSDEGRKALAVGLRYKVYYLPVSKVLMGIEPIIG